MKNITTQYTFQKLNEYFFLLLIMCMLVGVHFEGVFAIPTDFLREGSRFKIADLISLFFLGIIFLKIIVTGKVAKAYLFFIPLFFLISIISFLGPAENKGYLIVSNIWFFISFSAAFFIVDYLSVYKVEKLLTLLDKYLSVITLVYVFAFIDYLCITILGNSLIPDYLDYRQKQVYSNFLPRFEGFSVLSLGYVALGYFNMIIAIMLNRKYIAYFHLLLILLTLSTGGYIAFIICFSFYIFIRLNKASKFLSFIPLLAGAIIIMIALVLEKQATGGDWSYGVRIDFFRLLPEVLSIDPAGMGFGQSRFLYQYIERYSIGSFPLLFAKLTVEKQVVVESSHLELWYEFGYTGIILSLAYTYIVFRLCLKSLFSGNRAVAALTSVLLYFWIHAFFQAAYFYQVKFWLINLLMILIINKLYNQLKQETITTS